MKDTILISGGSGLVGTALTRALQHHQYEVIHLSRTPGMKEGVKAFEWHPEQHQMDENAFENAKAIIHLAGAGVADSRWTNNRKKEIISSRVASTALLYDMLKSGNHHVKTLISVSAIGYYGVDTGNAWVDETTPKGNGFLAGVTQLWESEVDKVSELGIRVVKLRLGIVLSKDGGALAKLMKPTRFGLAAPLGSGKQFMSWIHIDDLTRMFIHAVENGKVSGVYNAVSPAPVTNKLFTQTLAKVMHKPCLLPAVPEFALKLALGEMAQMLTGGNRVSSDKIRQTGFRFNYQSLEDALLHLVG